MSRPRAVLALLLASALLAGCGLRVDDSTRQALLRNQLSDPGTAAGPAIGPSVGPTAGTTEGGTALPGGTTGSSGTTGSAGPGSSPAPVGGGTGAALPPGGNGGASDIGVTPTSVTVGTVADRSGPRPGLFDGTIAGVQAYFAYVNSTGGVYGRRLKTALGDSGTACNQTAAAHKSLMTSTFAIVGSFGVYDNCAAPVFAQNPVVADVSYAISSERGAVRNNFSTQLQSGGAQAGPAQVFKQRFPGIEKKLGALIADVAASRSAWANLRSMYLQEGYSLVYEQFVSPTEVDYTRYVIGMRQAGVDMVVLTNDISGEVKFVNAAQQQTYTPRVITTRAVLYDPAFAQLVSGNPTNVYAELGSALYFNADERRIPGVALYQDWMKKTAPSQAQDSFSVFGWSQAQLFVEALRKAGPRATRPSLLAALRSIHALDTLGLLPSGDPALKKPTTCFLITHWESGHWRRFSSPASGFDCSKRFDNRR